MSGALFPRAVGHSRCRRLAATIAAVAILALPAANCGGGRKKRPPRPSSEEQYRTAMAMMDKKKYFKARQVLGDIGVRELQESALDPLVKLSLADAYFLDGGITNIIEAQSRYEQFINFYPSHEKAAYAQYQVGLCLFEQSAKPANDQEYTRKAMGEFEKVRSMNPASEYVALADKMIDKCREKLARHEFDVGLFYMRHKACEAASGRFREILKSYPHFGDTDGAYYYLGQSLLCSNNIEEGKIYLSKLINDYPESEYAAKAREVLASRRG